MFGQRLANERRRLGRNQEEFAQIISIGRSGYAAIEGDRAPLDVSRLILLGEVANVDVMYVMTGDRAAVAAASLMDWGLIDSIMLGMHSRSEALGIPVPIHKQGLALKLLYEKMAAKGCIDDVQALNDVLSLVDQQTSLQTREK